MYMFKPIYDCITNGIITSANKDAASIFSVDPSTLSHLRRGTILTLKDRFCLLDNKESLTFVLIDYFSREEFVCVTNTTIFLHLGVKYSDNEAKYIYELRKERQKTASLNGRVLCLKENFHKINMENLTKTKSGSLFNDVAEHKKSVLKQRKVYNTLLNRIYYAIRAQSAIKSMRTMQLVGCDIPNFISHIESQFQKGMTWDNHGLGKECWHIDHIIPCNNFNLLREEDQKRCFNYQNLRPLWSTENVSRPKDGRDMFGYGLNI